MPVTPNDGGLPRGDSFHRAFDPEVESASSCVVMAVAAVRGVQPGELERLIEAIDPDALNALFERDGRTEQDELRVVFDYEGFEVTIAEGDVWLRRAELREAASGGE